MDSTIIPAWILSKERFFKLFASSRVGEIQINTQPYVNGNIFRVRTTSSTTFLVEKRSMNYRTAGKMFRLSTQTYERLATRIF